MTPDMMPSGMPTVGNPVTAIVPSDGCGKAPPGLNGVQTIQTMGFKPPEAADTKKGAWMYNREYTVRMPTSYDNKKPYNLIFQGMGCNAGTPSLPYNYGNSVDQTAIMVALGLPPSEIGHAEVGTSLRCYDDKDKYSVEIEFYEALYDRLNSQLCFDRNRVFIGGNSSGGWLSNELGCKYAGDEKRPIRAFMPNTGGLPMPDRNRPPCSDKPRSGFWVHERGDQENPFTGTAFAVQEAMKVNKCTMGTSYATATLENYPVPGLGMNTCQKLRGCPDLYPLVVCNLPGNQHGSHNEVVNPGVNTFIKMFSSGIFLTQ
jgi:polyhydroxybutyrate depolymerase